MKKTMDVGQVTVDGQSFDVDNLAETNSVLHQGATVVKWIFQNEESQIVILEKPRMTTGVGSYIIVEDGAVGRLSESQRPERNTVGRLAKPYVRDSVPREVIMGSEVVNAYLQTVKLI